MSTKKQSKQPTKKQLIETCEELEKGVECVRGFLEQAEEQMKTLSSDGTIPTEGETCLGCRLQGYAEHNHAVFKTCLNQNDKLEEEIKKLKRDIDGDGMLYKGHKKEMSDVFTQLKSSVKQIVKLEEENKKLNSDGQEQHDHYENEILDLKSQIPDKKGKKLSQKDKELLDKIWQEAEHQGPSFTPDAPPTEAARKLIKRLMN